MHPAGPRAALWSAALHAAGGRVQAACPTRLRRLPSWVQALQLESEMGQRAPAFCSLPYTGDKLVDTLRLLAIASDQLANALVSAACASLQKSAPVRKRKRKSQDGLSDTDGSQSQCIAIPANALAQTAGESSSAPNAAMLLGMPIAADCIQGEAPAQMTVQQLVALSEALHFLGVPMQHELVQCVQDTFMSTAPMPVVCSFSTLCLLQPCSCLAPLRVAFCHIADYMPPQSL
jgi:hypothetical protein